MSLDFFLIPLSILLILFAISLGSRKEIRRTTFKKKYIRK